MHARATEEPNAHPAIPSRSAPHGWLPQAAAAGCLALTAAFAMPGASAAAAAQPAKRTSAAQAQPAERDKAAPSPQAARPATPAEADQLAAHIAQKWKVPEPTARRVVQTANAHAPKQRLSPTLVLAIVAQESGFRPTVQSNRGA